MGALCSCCPLPEDYWDEYGHPNGHGRQNCFCVRYCFRWCIRAVSHSLTLACLISFCCIRAEQPRGDASSFVPFLQFFVSFSFCDQLLLAPVTFPLRVPPLLDLCACVCSLCIRIVSTNPDMSAFLSRLGWQLRTHWLCGHIKNLADSLIFGCAFEWRLAAGELVSSF